MIDKVIYQINKEENIEVGESLGDIEHKFVATIAGIITEKLRINLQDRNIVENLIISSIKKDLTTKNGLLDQYLHYYLDKIKTRFINELGLDENIETDYNFVYSYKFESLLKAIKEKINNNNKGGKKCQKKRTT